MNKNIEGNEEIGIYWEGDEPAAKTPENNAE
jgi:hypothetical protein